MKLSSTTINLIQNDLFKFFKKNKKLYVNKGSFKQYLELTLTDLKDLKTHTKISVVIIVVLVPLILTSLQTTEKDATHQKASETQVSSKAQQDSKTSTTKRGNPNFSTKNFDYWECKKELDSETINFFFDRIMLGVELYNKQDKAKVKMALPNVEFCYISVAKGDAQKLLGSRPTVEFFVSRKHLNCNIGNNCTNDLRGYNASIALVPGNQLQIQTGTDLADNWVFLCLNKQTGKTKYGRCGY